jgi:hypothetical protein
MATTSAFGRRLECAIRADAGELFGRSTRSVPIAPDRTTGISFDRTTGRPPDRKLEDGAHLAAVNRIWSPGRSCATTPRSSDRTTAITG